MQSIEDILKEYTARLDNLRKEEHKSYYNKKIQAEETSEEYQRDQFLSKNK